MKKGTKIIIFSIYAVAAFSADIFAVDSVIPISVNRDREIISGKPETDN